MIRNRRLLYPRLASLIAPGPERSPWSPSGRRGDGRPGDRRPLDAPARSRERDRPGRAFPRRREPDRRGPGAVDRPGLQGRGPVHVPAGRADGDLPETGLARRPEALGRGRHPLRLRTGRAARAGRGRILHPHGRPGADRPRGRDRPRRPARPGDPAPAPERRQGRVFLPLLRDRGQAALHLAGAPHRRRAALPSGRGHQAQPRRHGRGQDERPPSGT